jgi:hypothetical protein
MVSVPANQAEGFNIERACRQISLHEYSPGGSGGDQISRELVRVLGYGAIDGLLCLADEVGRLLSSYVSVIKSGDLPTVCCLLYTVFIYKLRIIT